MNCEEARRALQAGTMPGSQNPLRVQLGFHLANCSACRSYSAAVQARMLSAMLNVPAQPPVPLHPTANEPVLPPPPPRAHAVPAVPGTEKDALIAGNTRPLIVLAGVLLVGALLFLIAPPVGSLLRIHSSVQAMTVESPTVLSVLPTATSTPTASPTPSPSPLPTATATIAPTATFVPTPAPPDPGGAMTIALLGTDRRPGEAGAARSDALIVAHVDPVHGRVAILSLPRDLYVAIPGYGYGRINSATARAGDDPAAGGELARATLSKLLGIQVDYYVTVDFEGFIGAIDAIGGITVDVQRELYDSRFPTMDYGYSEVYFAAGPQQFDGEDALTYSRIRHPDSDFARMKRQQTVVTAILGQLRQQGAHESLGQLEAMTAALRDYVHTDIPEDRLLGVAWALRDTTAERVERYTLEANMVSFGVGDDRWAEVPLPGRLDALVARLLGG